MKTVTIEELLGWAFMNELPKGGGVDGLDNVNSAWRMLDASSWGKVMRFGELGTLIDRGAREGGNFFIDQGEPHPDALVAGRAVAALAALDVVIPPGWQPLSDWPDPDGRIAPLAREAVDRAVAKFTERSAARRGAGIVSLVVSRAVLGLRPDWSSEPSKLRLVERNGRPAWFVMREVRDNWGQPQMREVDGFNARSGRPLRGAYRKWELSADPVSDILSRLDWQIWVAALGRVAVACGVLERHRVMPFMADPAPWTCGAAPCVGLVERGVARPRKKVAATG